MATNLNQTIRQGKVTPGVYDVVNEQIIPSTSNISVTSLGLVSELQKGPAFEIVSINNWADFKKYFGGTDTTKYSGGIKNARYEGAYIANEYLKESNNLYVSRILGLSGYSAGRSWGIVLSGDTIDNEIAAVIRSKGTLQSGQTMLWSIGDDETLTASITSLTESFDIKISTETAVDSLSIPITSTSLSGVLYRNDVLVTSATTIPVAGLAVDITDGYLGGIVDLISVSGTTIPTEENSTKLTTATLNNDNSLTLPAGTTFYMYNTPLQSSVKITTADKIIITGVSLDDSGNIIYTAASTLTLTNTTVSYFLKATSGDPLITVSLENTDTDFILNVLGTTKDATEESIWVDEYYLDGYDWATLLADSNLTISLVELPKFDCQNFKSIYKPGRTPWIVSQVSGGKVKNLFRFITISDGESANTEIKVSIENVDTINKTFDVLVRAFGDTDDNVVILESYRNLNLIKDDKNYIGKRIGDADGEYLINSSYIVVEIADGSLHNDSPSGFEGYPIRKHTDYTYPDPTYYTAFNEDVKVRRQYLGIKSSTSLLFDLDFLKYKGINTSTGSDWGTYDDEKTLGFHIQTEASTITGFTTPTTSVFIDPDTGDAYSADDQKLRYKFTTMFHSGFDGWNIFATSRGLSSNYKYNKAQGIAGLANQSFTYFTDNDFPEGTKAITSDYYAFYKGFRVFSNPKTVDINLLTVAGIDWSNQASLVDEVIDMVENERCDALYLVASPDSTDNTVAGLISPKEVSQLMSDSGFDTKFATTFYPNIQYADTENDSRYIWLSPIKDLVRSIAYTDNIAYPWFAPVGFARGNVSAIRARTKLKVADTEYLTSANINYVETFTAEGLRLWGQRLMRKDSDDWVLSRIGVQRLMLYLRANIRNVVKKDIFEQNDDVLVDTIKKQIDPILSGVAGQRGIERGYKLDVLQTPEDKDLRQVRVKIYLKPIGAVEFIEIEFNVNPSSVTF